MTRPITDTQLRALDLLMSAYEEDVAARPAVHTKRRADGTIGINHVAAERLVMQDLARFSLPKGNFVLITEMGRDLAIKARQAPKGSVCDCASPDPSPIGECRKCHRLMLRRRGGATK